MDATEQIVNDFLSHQGYRDIEYEPLGRSKAPDFSVNGRIAIEVRRLNQHHFAQARARGLEVDAHPLIQKVQSTLATYGEPAGGKSWYVFVRFSRPTPGHKQIAIQTRMALDRFIIEGEQNSGRIHQTQTFALDLYKAGPGRDQKFVFGGYNDIQSGGFVVEQLEKNIQYCVNEKAEKISGVHHMYPEWWLALVDHIGFHFGESRSAAFQSVTLERQQWDRILVISPRPPHQVSEV
ncbi:MAG: hypothetical protein ACRERR_01810 [Moraxellaceae bacterium]